MKMTHEAYYAMLNYLGSRPAESGGILFGYENDFVIRKFIPDEFASTTRNSYTMSTDFINLKIRKLWEEEQLSLLGIVHSHPYGNKFPSSPDSQYFSDLMTYIGLDVFYTPIINALADGELDCHHYAFEKDSPKPIPTRLLLVEDNYQDSDEGVPATEENEYETPINHTVFVVQKMRLDSSFYAYTLFTFSLLVVFSGLFCGMVYYLFLNMLRIIH